MGKRKSKMKLSSRKNGTLVPDDDSDSDLQEFPLPKKRIIKPGKSTYVARLENYLLIGFAESLKAGVLNFLSFVCEFINSFSNISEGDVIAVEFAPRCSSQSSLSLQFCV